MAMTGRRSLLLARNAASASGVRSWGFGSYKGFAITNASKTIEASCV
jgi:hypothetical protein